MLNIMPLEKGLVFARVAPRALLLIVDASLTRVELGTGMAPRLVNWQHDAMITRVLSAFRTETGTQLQCRIKGQPSAQGLFWAPAPPSGRASVTFEMVIRS